MKNGWKWIGGIAAALLVLVVVRVITASHVSDAELIRNSLDESLRAGREGRPGGVLEFLSRSLTVNDGESVSRRQIARFVRDSKPKVTVENRKPVISPDGETAVILTNVSVNVDYLGMKLDRELPNVEINFRKEPDTQFLVFPATKWRIVSVTAPTLDMSQLLPMQ